MCGIFGYISNKGRRPNLRRLARIAQATESRGPHAFGLAWVDPRGRLRCYKQTGRISDHLGILTQAADARMIIGHCRYATAGDPANNLNNHPFACDGGWLMHNGTVPNASRLQKDHDLWPVTQCDSEIIALLIETANGTLARRCAAALAQIRPQRRARDGEQGAALLGLWSRPRATLILSRNGKPLHAGSTEVGTYFASLPRFLPDDVQPVPDGGSTATPSTAKESPMPRKPASKPKPPAAPSNASPPSGKPARRASSPGRPRFGRETLSEMLPFRVTPTQKQALAAEAARLNCTEADVLRNALDLYFESSGSSESASRG